MAMLLRLLLTLLFLKTIFFAWGVVGKLYVQDEPVRAVSSVRSASKYHNHSPVYHKTAHISSELNQDFKIPEIACSAGFTLHNMECRKLTKQPPKFFCPSGYAENEHHTECIRKITSPPVPYCDDGYEHFNGKCSKITEEVVEYQCPPSYRLIGKKCVESVVVNPGVTCHDYTMIGQSCDKQIKIDAIKSCPERHLLDPVSLQCFQLETHTPYPVCPKGALPETGGCVKIIKLMPFQECSSGFELKDSLCVKEDVVRVSTNCEGDLILNENSECIVERSLPVELACEDGMKLDPATGDCILRKKPKLVCTEGGEFNPVTNQCEYMMSILPSFFCPEGYERNGSNCVKTTKQPMKISCPEGFRVYEGTCVKRVPVDPNLKCPEGFSLMAENCVRKTYAKMILKCPEGYELYVDRCIMHKSFTPDFYCPDGFVLTGQKCMKERNIDATVRCPYNFELKENKCVRVLEESAKPRCFDDYKYNQLSGFCEGAKTVLPEIKCPYQFEYKKENGGICVRLETRPVIRRCTAGRVYDTYSNSCGFVKGVSTDREHFKKHSIKHKFIQDKYKTHSLIKEPKKYKTHSFIKEPKKFYKTHSFVKEPKMYKKKYFDNKSPYH